MIETLGQDLIQPIFSFLTQEEAFALRLTCKTFNVAATSNQMITPFLNRLKAIDNKVSVLPPEKVSLTWCYERFACEFIRIANAQAREINHFLANAAKLPKLQAVQDELAKLRAWSGSGAP